MLPLRRLQHNRLLFVWMATSLAVLAVGCGGQEMPESTTIDETFSNGNNTDATTKNTNSMRIEDIFLWRKLGGERLGLDLLPDGLHQELLKLFMFPTGVTSSPNVSRQCVEDTVFYYNNLLTEGSDWATKMLETSGQLPTGLLTTGNYHAEGLFEECQMIRTEPNRFKGQFCNVYFKLVPLDNIDPYVKPETISTSIYRPEAENSNIEMALRKMFGSSLSRTQRVDPKQGKPDGLTFLTNNPTFSLCLPSSCTASDLGNAVSQMVGHYVIANQSIVTVTSEHSCFTDDKQLPPLDGLSYSFLMMLGTFMLVVTVATVFQGWREFHGVEFSSEKDSKAVSLLYCFSTIRNGRKLLSMKSPSNDGDHLPCLHGMRFLSTCWIAVAHTYLKTGTFGKPSVINPNTLFTNMMADWKSMIVINASVAVDTFFTISGLLVSFLLFKTFDRTKGKINLGLLYLQRYLRLTPTYAILIGYTATLAIYSGSGPHWYSVHLANEGCRAIWWQHLLYIHNMFPLDYDVVCMGDSWYLAVDMQLFIIAPLFVYTMWRWKRIGFAMVVVTIIVSLVLNFVALVVYELPPTMMFSRYVEMGLAFTSFVDNLYSQTWTRAPPYFIGIMAGWLLHRFSKTKLKLPNWLVVLLWALTLATTSAVLFGLISHLDEVAVPKIDTAARLTYGALHRTAWSLSVAWIIVACTKGYGGFINRLLSWKGFMPLSRLTYCVYLIQFGHISLFYTKNRRMIYYTATNTIMSAMGLIVTGFATAFFLSILFESPFINLMKLAFAKKKEHKGDSNDGDANTQLAVETTAVVAMRKVHESYLTDINFNSRDRISPEKDLNKL